MRAFRALDNMAVVNGRAWMLTIVHNTACNWLNKHRRSTVVAVDDLDAFDRATIDAARTDSETPEGVVIARVDVANLEAAMAELPLPYRETLVLRDVQGLNYREIAQVTGVPIGTVMSRLARARSRLAAAIGRNGT